MRLLKRSPTGEVSVTRDLFDDIPAYAILSHTWGAEDDEVTLEDIEKGQTEGKAGWTKLEFCGAQAARDGLQYFWIDTCCINRANHAELQESITSMFRWYRAAAKCYVYLSNVSAPNASAEDQTQPPSWEAAFRKSRWFTRGWTLQELLAPSSVEFFSREGHRLGSKKTLESLIHRITKIPLPALRGDPLSDFSVDDRLSWASGRNTKKPEDKAYCLLGLFNIFMPLIYGEGDNAFVRLREEIARAQSSKISATDSSLSSPRSSLLDVSERLPGWLSPADPKLYHDRISRSRAAGSGTWFLERQAFKHWVASEDASFLWLRGISGAGKTTLMSTIIDDLLQRTRSEMAVGYFYCSFDDTDSQLTANMFGSILAQFSAYNDDLCQELSVLYREKLASGDGKAKRLPLEQMIEIISRFSQRQSKTFIVIDAVNEASEPLSVLETLRSLAPHCTIIMSSINTAGFEEYLQPIFSLSIQSMHPYDIQQDVDVYVRAFLETHDRMRGLPLKIKSEIVQHLTQGNNGMFRWVQCQIAHLAHLRTPGQIRAALTGMPVTLDKTYEVLLSRIDERDKDMVIEVLLFLTFCVRPLTLDELCQALQVTPGLRRLDEDKLLLYPMDLVSVCGGLVDFDEKTRVVSLAHHSVKTYLTSSKLQATMPHFYLEEDNANQHFAEKCLSYLSMDAFASGPCKDKFLLEDRLTRFPFYAYASLHWALHAQKVPVVKASLSIAMQKFFSDRDPARQKFLAWVQVLLPQHRVEAIADTPPLYYASSFGLTTIVKYLINSGADLEAHGGRFGATALGIASYRGHADVVKLLLDAGADPYNPDYNPGWHAVNWARANGHKEVLDILLARGQYRGSSRMNRTNPRTEFRTALAQDASKEETLNEPAVKKLIFDSLQAEDDPQGLSRHGV